MSQTAPSDFTGFTTSLWHRFCRRPGIRNFLLGFTLLDRPFSPCLLGVKLTRPEIGLLGEVDIVARHGKALSFVEVKTRTSTAFGRPADAVNKDKQQLIQRGALDWLRLLGNPRIPIRFDIAEVVLVSGEMPAINIIENAFVLPDSSLAGR